jgi:hypothetical protein
VGEIMEFLLSESAAAVARDSKQFGQNVIGITGAAPIWYSVIERVSGRCKQDTDDILIQHNRFDG